MAKSLTSIYVGDLNTYSGLPGSTPELSLRPALGKLLPDAAQISGTTITCIPEARANAGQPDYTVVDGSGILGYVETKAPGADLTPDTPQLKRYVAALPNLIITDYNTFNLYRDGELVLSYDLGLAASLKAGKAAATALTATADEDFAGFFERFLSYAGPTVDEADVLAMLLARRARIVRDAIENELLGSTGSPFHAVLDFFRTDLYPDIDVSVFADTIAQTIVYGLFLARLNVADPAAFDIRTASSAIPDNVAFLRSAMKVVESGLTAGVLWIVEDIISLLRRIDVPAIVAQVASVTASDDAVLYFYEPFLRAYDAEERIKRGVYYTPAPLVDFIVKAIGDLLVRDFGKHTGLGEQDVTVLDPALGTGTFLLQVLGAAIDSIVAVRGTGAQAAAIRDEVLPRVIGFEVLPAPYAIAQLRLETFLKSKGVSLGPNERARIYLSNTLNEPTTRSHHLYALPMLKTLVGEVNEADKVKADERVLVIVGNPPYERDSPFNDSKYINNLMEDFRKVDGTRIRDQNQKALNSDYVRFFRWAFAKLLEFQPNFGAGVVAFVSNNGYTDAATLVGMRRWMLDNFDDIYIFDLHGDQRNWIRGEPDEKIFKEVQVGIAITIAVRTPRPPPNEVAPGGFRATLHYREQRGTNAAKFGALRVSSIGDGQWNTLPSPEAPEYLFLPVGARTDYGKWPAVPDLFLKGSYGVGVQTSRDDFIVAFDPADLKARFADLASPTVTDDELRERYGLRTTRDFDLAAARRAAKTFDPKKVKQYRYRLLDRRWTYFDPIFIDWPRQVSEHLVDGENIALAVPRQRRGDGQLATVSREIVDLNLFGSGTHVYPLYQRSGAAALVSAHNLCPGLLSGLAVGLGRSVTPEDVFNYVAAVLMSAAYTDAFELRLGADHPRVSFTKNPTLFQDIVDAGKELTRLQSLRIVPAEYTSKLDGNGSATIGRPTFDRANLRIVVGDGLFLTNVSEEAWTYKIGQYYVLERYLEDRVGRVLSSVDTTELIRVATAVDATIQIMPTLDDLVRRCIAGPTFVVAELQ